MQTMLNTNIQIPQHSSSKIPWTTFSTPPFAKRWNLWGTYTEAVVIILKPGYYWDSGLASVVPWEDGSHRSVLPMMWDMQLDYPSASKKFRVKIWTQAPSTDGS